MIVGHGQDMANSFLNCRWVWYTVYGDSLSLKDLPLTNAIAWKRFSFDDIVVDTFSRHSYGSF